jgi:serine/threonine protein kinase
VQTDTVIARDARVSPVDPMIGRVIDGRYRLETRLGAGGMGVVYAARHDVTGREVAVKLLHPSGQHSDEVIARFEREARTGAAIGHRNIVDVLDAGSLPDGTPFLVMEMLRGECLAERLARETHFAPALVAEIVLQAASALEALHAISIIHRDVKTDNLFVDAEGCVKLLDFGLAVFTDGAAPGRVTKEGVLNGTPEYMPPEVFEGRGPTVAWDVYALATVAFELLTGVVPFEGATPLVILCGKREHPAPRLSERTDATFSSEIEHVIARGLARSPARRQPTPMAFAMELAEAVREASPRSTMRERTPRARWPEARRRTAWLASGAAAVILVTSIAIARSEPSAEPSVVVPTRASTGALVEAIAPAEPMRPPEGLEAPTPEAPPVVTAVVSPTDTTHAHRSRHRTPSQHESRAAAARAETTTARSRDVDEVADLVRAGTSALMRGMIPDAIDALGRATVASPRSSAAWRGLGLANERVGRRSEARRAYERYLSLAPTAPDADEIRRRIATL